MKRIFYKCLASAVLIAGSGVAIGAALPASEPREASETRSGDEQELIADSPKVKGESVIDGRDLYLKFTITTPTECRNAEWDYFDIEHIDKLVLFREAENWWDDGIEVNVWTEVQPGTEYVYEDREQSLNKGKEYTYFAVAYIGERAGSNGYAYVTLGITPVTPDYPVLEPTGIGTPVTVTYSCPELLYQKDYWSDPEPMPEGITYDAITLTRSSNGEEVVIDKHDNPQPGEQFVYVDNDAPDGTVVYKVKTSTFAGESSDATSRIFLGYDYPGAPTELKAIEQDGKVVVSWEAPKKGYNDGVLDPETLRYSVYRKTGDYDYNPKLLADNLTECTYTDDLADLTEETVVNYRVVPYNNVETPSGTYNYAETYSGLIVGPPVSLPFVETFNSGNKFNKSFDKRWDSNFSYYSFSDYYIRNGEMSITVGDNTLSFSAGVDGGSSEDENGADGFFYVSPATYYNNTDNGYLTSGNISLAEVVNPIASFYYMPINNSTGKIALEIYTGQSDDEGNPIWNEVGSVICDDPELGDDEMTTELKWKKVSFPMNDYIGVAKAKIRLNFVYTDPNLNRYPMPLDNVAVDDYPGATDFAVVRNDVDGNLELSWSLPQSAGAKSPTFNIYLNGELLASTSETSYTFVNPQQGEKYTFSVETVYPDGVVAPNTDEISYMIDLTSFTVDGVTYTVEEEGAVRAYSFSSEADIVTIPASVEYKGREFEVVDMMVELFKGNRQLSSVNIEAPLSVLPVGTFYGCVSLTDVMLPATIEEIGSRAFFGCAKLESIDLPSGVKSIGESAFEHAGLKSILFGDNLTEIETSAFRYCESLESVTFSTMLPPEVGSNAFEGVASPCVGICPAGSEDAYKAVENLKPLTFGQSGVETLESFDGASDIQYFTTSGVKVDNPIRGGVTIVRAVYPDGSVKTSKLILK